MNNNNNNNNKQYIAYATLQFLLHICVWSRSDFIQMLLHTFKTFLFRFRRKFEFFINKNASPQCYILCCTGNYTSYLYFPTKPVRLYIIVIKRFDTSYSFRDTISNCRIYCNVHYHAAHACFSNLRHHIHTFCK